MSDERPTAENDAGIFRLIDALRELADEPPTAYPDNCGCSHGMGFQFHRFPCDFAGDVSKAAVRAVLDRHDTRVFPPASCEETP